MFTLATQAVLGAFVLTLVGGLAGVRWHRSPPRRWNCRCSPGNSRC